MVFLETLLLWVMCIHFIARVEHVLQKIIVQSSILIHAIWSFVFPTFQPQNRFPMTVNLCTHTPFSVISLHVEEKSFDLFSNLVKCARIYWNGFFLFSTLQYYIEILPTSLKYGAYKMFFNVHNGAMTTLAMSDYAFYRNMINKISVQCLHGSERRKNRIYRLFDLFVMSVGCGIT